ncbi:MAG: hypothetical protein U5K79_03000 [Cyclobacteriaceae bacterium]|nr:hypothetical protein [Cyclobacteriaceae bacterium]
MNRREFTKNSSNGLVLAAFGASFGSLPAACASIKKELNITAGIPLPIQVVIDDVGWWSGKDGSLYQEPFRTGINRNHVIEDYKAIIDLGKTLGIKPQAAMVLGEWDKQNILRNVPHSTWMGEKWDNKKWVGPWLEETADLISANQQHFEITIHGLGHEWWTNGKFTRAEWADDQGVMRPKEILVQHLDAYAEIMHQNKLGELPKSFVPNAFKHSFGITKGNEISMAELLASRGVTYINTPFDSMFNKSAVQHNFYGVDSGIMTIDRGSDIFDWNVIGPSPEGTINGPTCGLHWPNLLHENPERNSEIVEGWVRLLDRYNAQKETMLAKNSHLFQQQLAHHSATKIVVQNNEIKMDFSGTNQLGTIIPNKELTVKVTSDKEIVFSSDIIRIVSVTSKQLPDFILYSLNLELTDQEDASIFFKIKV